MSIELQIQGRCKIYDKNGMTRIPKDIRDYLGVGEEDNLVMVVDDNGRVVMDKEE